MKVHYVKWNIVYNLAGRLPNPNKIPIHKSCERKINNHTPLVIRSGDYLQDKFQEAVQFTFAALQFICRLYKWSVWFLSDNCKRTTMQQFLFDVNQIK